MNSNATIRSLVCVLAAAESRQALPRLLRYWRLGVVVIRDGGARKQASIAAVRRKGYSDSSDSTNLLRVNFNIWLARVLVASTTSAQTELTRPKIFRHCGHRIVVSGATLASMVTPWWQAVHRK